MNTQIIVKPAQPESHHPDYIFYKFDSLKPGKGFIIHDDNDPHPLYSQLLKAKGDTFSWEYLPEGPKKWRVKISKIPNGNIKETIGEMAVSDHRKAMILRKYGLDFSFKGKRTLMEACAEKEISIKEVERELAASGQQSLVYAVNYNSWELDYLTDFMVTNHHRYTRTALANIAGEFEKQSKLIQENNPGLIPLVEAFMQLKISMNIIMLQEEQVLFPYIRFLVQVTRGKITGNPLPPGSVQDHIRRIESEHLKIQELVQYISNFTSDYTMPVIENPFYAQVLQWLNEFDNDLHQHVHIENNILFRKALVLEQEYFTTARNCTSIPEKNSSRNNHLYSLL